MKLLSNTFMWSSAVHFPKLKFESNFWQHFLGEGLIYTARGQEVNKYLLSPASVPVFYHEVFILLYSMHYHALPQ